jgi:hypothetical protein
MVDLREWLDAVDADDSLFEGLLAALTCVAHDKMGKDGVEKARRDISRLVPRKRVRVSRHGAHLQTYYYRPDKVEGKKVGGKKIPHPVDVAHRHGEHLKEWAERMAQYYLKRATTFKTPEVQKFAEELWERVRKGETRLGGVVERYLEQQGLTREKPTVGSPLNAPLMHFLFGATFSHHTLSPEFHEFHERIFDTMETSDAILRTNLTSYDEKVKEWTEQAARLREDKIVRNAAVAFALAASIPRRAGEPIEKEFNFLRENLRKIFRERQNLNRAQMLALVGAWTVWTGEPINAELENRLRALFDAERRKEGAWRRYLEHQVMEWELGARVIWRYRHEKVDLSKVTEKQLKEDIEKEWRKLNPDAKEGFYERQKRLLAELETRRRTAYKHALRVYDHLAEGIAKASPDYRETLDLIRQVSQHLQDGLRDEMRLKAKVAAKQRLGKDTTADEAELEAVRRSLRAFKELHTQLVGSMLVHSATNRWVPLPHWSSVMRVIHAIQEARSQHPSVAAWRWERLTGIKHAKANLLDPEARDAVREHENAMLELLQEQEKAPESVVRFVATARTRGRIYDALARAYKALAENPSFNDILKVALSSMTFRHFTL